MSVLFMSLEGEHEDLLVAKTHLIERIASSQIYTALHILHPFSALD